MMESRARKRWILITRAREQGEQTARELRERGYLTLVDPVFETRRVPFSLPQPESLQAVLLTSANAVYALGRELAGLPVYAVGRGTARAVRQRGATDVRAARGDWQSLVERVVEELDPRGGKLLHLSGREVRGDIAGELEREGFSYERVVVYETAPREEIGSRTRHALSRRAVGAVLLYSPRTAATFARLVRDSGLEAGLEGVLCVCLSEAVAEEVTDLSSLEIVVARERDHTALLDCLEAHMPSC